MQAGMCLSWNTLENVCPMGTIGEVHANILRISGAKKELAYALAKRHRNSIQSSPHCGDRTQERPKAELPDLLLSWMMSFIKKNKCVTDGSFLAKGYALVEEPVKPLFLNQPLL